jgi:hypothetical protein
MLTFWDDSDAIKRFAGDDFKMAKYYDFDSDYLIEKEAGVRHYGVSSLASTPGSSNRKVSRQERLKMDHIHRRENGDAQRRLTINTL